jgi:cyclic pyranopterin phosphate synthase
LDTLSEVTFEKISRRTGLAAVLQGIAAAQQAGFSELRINAVSMSGINEQDLVPLARFCREQNLHLRLIEFMPLDAEQNWGNQPILTGRQVRDLLSQSICPLEPLERADPSQPAVDFRYSDGVQQVGFINSISEPFCNSCNRLRLTAEGKFRNCLFGTEEWDARAVLRQGGSNDDLIRLLQDCVWKKKSGHGIGEPGFVRPGKSMYQIGG